MDDARRAVAATILWLLVSLLFKLYIANFTDYEGSYGTVGGSSSSFSGSTYLVSPFSRAPNSTPKSNTRLRTGKRRGRRTRTESCSSGSVRRAHFDNVSDQSKRRSWSLRSPGFKAHPPRRPPGPFDELRSEPS